MKKYGIISLNIYEKDNNWGSILQSYALQKFVEKQGCEVKIVDICPDFINKFEARYPIVRALPFNLKKLKHTFRNSVLNFETFIKRDNKFKKFIKENYNCTKKHTKNNLLNEHFDGFIVGSDIVWNIDFTNGFDDLYFCDLPEMRKLNNIAYAPSMCDRKFLDHESRVFRQKLLNFKYISVREKSQVEYVQNFTEKKVYSVIDPTMLLYEEDYSEFLLDRIIKEDYVLIYTVPTDNALVEYATKYAKSKNLKVVLIECLNIQKNNKDCISYNDAGIEEWLTLIKYADKVFTNSFHACIFSIIFKKQFHAVYRNPGKTKIADLCDELEILNYSEKSNNYSFDINKLIDYEKVNKKLDKLKEESAEYLINAINEGVVKKDGK